MATARVVVVLLLCIAAAVVYAQKEFVHTRVSPFNVVASEGLSFEDIQNNIRARSVKRGVGRKIYNLTDSPTAGAGKTIAIICAYSHPSIESDLNNFAVHFGLPNCTIASGCLKIVNQTGGTITPGVPTGTWPIEIALDVQMTHAIAPGAKKLLILGNTDSTLYFLPAVQYAQKHADYLTMSWGSPDPGWEASIDVAYMCVNTSVSKFAATGDHGAQVQWPAVSNCVVGVGGTSVYMNNDVTFAYEMGWSGSGGGCSKVFNGSTAQTSSSAYAAIVSQLPHGNCSSKARALPDVAMVADPSSGVYIYNGYLCNVTKGCFTVIGGTSAASPIFAARAAVYGHIVDHTAVYGSSIPFRDVLSGSNVANGFGYSCGAGFDLVTGRGAWANPVDSVATVASVATTTAAATTTTKATATTSTVASASSTTAAKATTSTAASPSASASTSTSASASASTSTSSEAGPSTIGESTTDVVIASSDGSVISPQVFIILCIVFAYLA